MLQVKNISFSYTDGLVLNNISFNLHLGEIISVIGESGSGKSTLLKVLFGILEPRQGEVLWNNKKLLGPSYNLIPGETFMKYVSQDFELMPYTTVSENIGAYLSPFEPEDKNTRIKELLALIDMVEFENTKVQFLSGGQKQRVALAKALAQVPELLFLDEPFSQIDHFKKNTLRYNLFAFLKKKNTSCIIVSHDMTDALAFADKTIILKNGRLKAFDTPQKLYNQPNDFYTASLFGDVNLIDASLILANKDHQEKLLIYPHEFQVNPIHKGLKVRVKSVFFKGHYYLIKGLNSGQEILFTHTQPIPVDTVVYLTLKISNLENRLANQSN